MNVLIAWMEFINTFVLLLIARLPLLQCVKYILGMSKSFHTVSFGESCIKQVNHLLKANQTYSQNSSHKLAVICLYSECYCGEWKTTVIIEAMRQNKRKVNVGSEEK